jgi:hypothetical protein
MTKKGLRHYFNRSLDCARDDNLIDVVAPNFQQRSALGSFTLRVYETPDSFKLVKLAGGGGGNSRFFGLFLRSNQNGGIGLLR